MRRPSRQGAEDKGSTRRSFAQPDRTFIKENRPDGKRIAAFACESGAGAEKAFGKLKAALGIERLEAELILIDPMVRPSEENEQKIKAFCSELARAAACP